MQNYFPALKLISYVWLQIEIAHLILLQKTLGRSEVEGKKTKLCLVINQAVSHKNVWRWVSFTPRPFNPQRKSHRYPLYSRKGGPQSRSIRSIWKKWLLLPVFEPWSSNQWSTQCAHWAVKIISQNCLWDFFIFLFKRQNCYV